MINRFLLMIHNNDGTLSIVSLHGVNPLEGAKTLSEACRRISRYELTHGKDFSIIDVKTNTIYPSDYCEFTYEDEWG